MLRCAITDRSLFPGDESQKRSALVRQAALWAAQGIDIIQLREKDLTPHDLTDLAQAVLAAIVNRPATEPLDSPAVAHSGGPAIPPFASAAVEKSLSSRPERSGAERPASPPTPHTRLLINTSLRTALDIRAHGVHLPAHSPLLPEDVRRQYDRHRLPPPLVTVSCHNLAEIQIARRNQADAILFSPVFGKTVQGQEVIPAAGLEALHEACAAATPIPVYALGGITEEIAPQCVAAGAAGIAGIRLFHDPLLTPAPQIASPRPQRGVDPS